MASIFVDAVGDTQLASDMLLQSVNEKYGNVATKALGDHGNTASYHDVATAFGYTAVELQAIPAGANLGLSCGNPIALANLREGEVVIDFGSGGGFDVFVAAQKIGPTGRAIGVDMNDQMIALAHRNAAKHPNTNPNISFVHAPITAVPLPPALADCIISNCVVNLVPHAYKYLVFEEMFRLLRPGGRVAVSDLLARKPLPEALRADVAAYVGCVAGTVEVGEYEGWLRDAGFEEVVVVDAMQDANQYKSERLCAPESETQASGGRGCCETSSGKVGCAGGPESQVLGDYDLNEWIGSFKIFAVKK